MSAKARKTKDVYRSAVNGQFITERKAKSKPDKSVKHRYPIK